MSKEERNSTGITQRANSSRQCAEASRKANNILFNLAFKYDKKDNSHQRQILRSYKSLVRPQWQYINIWIMESIPEIGHRKTGNSEMKSSDNGLGLQ